MTILAATDFSDDAKSAIGTAASLACERDTSLTLLHCLEPPDGGSIPEPEADREMRAELRENARDRLEALLEEAVPQSTRPNSVDYRVEFAHAAEGICEVLGTDGYELAVLGATGRNRVANFFLGSTPEEVVRRTDVPVTVVPADAAGPPYDQIVAPIDFTTCSEMSLRHAAVLARRHGADLCIVHAYNMPSAAEASPIPSTAPSETFEALRKRRKRHFKELVDQIDLEGVDWSKRRRPGAPHNVIVDAVDELDADLVVMGTHGRRGFERFFLGSTATKVLRLMPCTIRTIRTRDEEST